MSVEKEPNGEFPELYLSANQSMPDQLFEKIQQMIISEQLPPGYCFPNENDLCRKLGIGRTTIRETYKALETRGYITRSKRGTYVNSVDEIVKSLPFSTAIGQSNFEDLIEFRTVFEAQIAKMAAIRATDEEIATLQKQVGKMKQHRDELQRLTYYDTQFHMTLAAASHNELMRRMMLMSCDVFAVGVYKAFNVDTEYNIDQAIDSHERILYAVENHLPDEAYEAMFAHVQTIKQRGI